MENLTYKIKMNNHPITGKSFNSLAGARERQLVLVKIFKYSLFEIVLSDFTIDNSN